MPLLKGKFRPAVAAARSRTTSEGERVRSSSLSEYSEYVAKQTASPGKLKWAGCRVGGGARLTGAGRGGGSGCRVNGVVYIYIKTKNIKISDFIT